MTAPRPRILFVDDESALLDGLKNRLFRQRQRWDMVFEPDSTHAIDAIRRESFEVVVSDLRMPGIDGAALLAAIRSERPSVARILLSGHGDRAAIVRALPAAHQLLSKPCDGSTLCEAIERGVRWAKICDAHKVRARLGALRGLPSSAGVIREMSARIAHGASPHDLAELVELAEQDTAVAAKLLQIASSTYFGIDAGVTSIGQAVSQIGAAQIAKLVLPASGEFKAPDGMAERARHGAVLARRWLGGAAGEIAYAGALLRSCAGIVLAGDVASHAIAEISASLLDLWGVPGVIADTVRWHRDIAHAPATVRELACAVHVADAVSGAHGAAGIDAAGVEAIQMSARVAGVGHGDQRVSAPSCRASAAGGRCRDPLP